MPEENNHAFNALSSPTVAITGALGCNAIELTAYKLLIVSGGLTQLVDEPLDDTLKMCAVFVNLSLVPIAINGSV
jgi:hypothetical protein